MAAQGFTAPVGTRDILPPESGRWARLTARFATLVGDAGYGLVQSPMFEELGVFERVGEGTDIVRKEMYDFIDKGDRHLALRPEGTASVVRAYLQHRPVSPWKTWYVAPSFRYERPQAGRYRQHHQLGAEAVGSPDPDLDVEQIVLAWDFFASVGLTDVSLLLNSMGTPQDRIEFAARLTAYLDTRRADLAPEDRDKVSSHPLRLLDSKRPATVAVLRDAPRALDGLSPEAARHFDRVRAGLDAVGIPYDLDPRLVRGLDYYTHTTFEFQATALDTAQNAIGGGGRYDGLAAALGGPDTPGVGFAAGIERILLACDAEGVFAPGGDEVDVFVVDVTGGGEALALTTELRRSGIRADRAFDGRSMKAQMKAANRSGARYALIVGDEERAAGVVALRDLRGPAEQRQLDRSELVPTLQAALAPDDAA